MQRLQKYGLSLLSLACLTAALSSPAAEPAPITTSSLLQEMSDLERLARWPEPAYRTVQFSSSDRRTTTTEAPGWFSNSDGFGGEPIPGFLQTLRAPGADRTGLYLLAEVRGPGAIVRGWSAGMGGVLRVYLDPPESPTDAGQGTLVWEGPAYDFLARRSARYFKQAGLGLKAKDAFIQEDADYFPIPFSRGLRVTWEGKLNEGHFYQLQVRLYPKATPVRSFDPQADLRSLASGLEETVARLVAPTAAAGGSPTELQGAIAPGRAWSWSSEGKGPGAIRELQLHLQADQLDAALRGCLLKIAFDGSQRPQVEAPVGDFFASGPGINPFGSLPFSVDAAGTMTCRFVMPYEKSVRVELVNFTAQPVQLQGRVVLAPWQWDERSMYFRAKWRADHDLLVGEGPIDMPYLMLNGKGVFVGCAAMLMNPSGAPLAFGNWWGEGDEKMFVDGEPRPSILGTGSEDYFNYAWSRPNLFAHPYCGQPLDSGPDTSGYVSNHRFQILDAIPCERSLAVFFELWDNFHTPGVSYARIAYHYARPNAVDDHRGLMPGDLRIPPLPKRTPQAIGGSDGAQFCFVDQLQAQASSGQFGEEPFPLATQLKLWVWHAETGGQLKLTLPVQPAGKTSLHLVAGFGPEGATFRARLDGKPLRVGGGSERVHLRSPALRDLNVHFEPVELKAGAHELVLECLEPGRVGLDYLWLKRE